jgi:small subunit ribosomal protein S4
MRYTGAVCRLCRREAAKLYLKGVRCHSAKCPFEGTKKREYPPGMHAWRRRKLSPWGVRLRETQKLKRVYGLTQRQFRMYFKRAQRSAGNTGRALLEALERRLDNVIYRLGFGLSRAHARQSIVHGHVLVNGKRVTVPSYPVKQGDVITPADREATKKMVGEAIDLARKVTRPSWLDREDSPAKGLVVGQPSRDEIAVPIDVQLVIEFGAR